MQSIFSFRMLFFLGAAFALNLLFGHFEFGGFDQGAVVDPFWRWHIGQKPYLDYICTLPPAYFMLGGFAFTLFGVHWHSIVLMESCFFLTLAVAGLLAIRQRQKHAAVDPYLPWVFVAALFIPTIETTHLYHSTMAASLAVYLLLVTFLFFSAFETTQKINTALLAQIGVAMAVLWLSKPNTAWAAIALTCAGAFRQPRLLRPMLAAAALSALAACALLLVNGIDPADVLRSYASISGRPSLWKALLLGISPGYHAFAATTLTGYALMALLLPAAWDLLRPAPGEIFTPSKLLAIGGIAVSLIGFCTNVDMKLNDTGPAILGCGLLVLSAPGAADHARHALRFAIVAACLTAFFTGEARIRMQLSGPWAGPQFGRRVLISDNFFWEFYTRRQFEQVLAALDKLAADTPHEAILLGPPLEFGYAYLGIAPPKHLPLWWHPGTSYPIADEADIVQTIRQGHFKKILLLAGHHGHTPDVLLKYLESYDMTTLDGVLEVYSEKRTGP